MPAQPSMTVGPFQFTSTGVRMSGRPTVDAWKGPLQFALWCQRAGPWWIGDLVNAGEDGFGEAFSQLCEGIVSDEQLSRYAAVARKVPREVRVPGLSWSAHAAVAQLTRDQQRQFLRRALQEGLTSEELRREVRAFQKSQTKTSE